MARKIAPVIEDEFKEVILPRIEETLSAFAGTIPSDSLQHLALSQKPAGGEYEKIFFHVYDERTGKDLLRFHVRRDRPPLEGYYFNFHYHSVEDEYATHYDLGNMYWGKKISRRNGYPKGQAFMLVLFFCHNLKIKKL
ncbi:hypothetical protein GCM10020331_065700 [Ectobacillus funiculus]